MKLYKNDYLTNLSDAEKDLYNELKLKKQLYEPGFNWLDSKKIRHYVSLFPNNFLDRYEIIESEILSKEKELLINILNNPETNERIILNFINNNRYYHIIGCILKKFPFGHHGAYLFKEFKLGTSFQADYLLIGDSSDGYHIIFVELEAPNGKIVNKDGRYSTCVNKGINQVKDWKEWIEKNYIYLKEQFNKSTRNDISLPKELYEYDSTRINYVVIAGRRKDYSEKTYRLRREYQKKDNIYILHYDNLLDLIDSVNIDNKEVRNY